jgi:hypothetical protein
MNKGLAGDENEAVLETSPQSLIKRWGSIAGAGAKNRKAGKE